MAYLASLPPCVLIIFGRKAVVSPTRLTVPAFGPESGTHQFKCLRGGGNRPTFRCTHPLTDKEAAPPLPVSAEASDCFKC